MRRIGRADLLIACIALAHDATVVTRNIRHFRQVPGLKIVDWSR
jgi:tRNA(fMet)-specific endonuclease VapC